MKNTNNKSTIRYVLDKIESKRIYRGTMYFYLGALKDFLFSIYILAINMPRYIFFLYKKFTFNHKAFYDEGHFYKVSFCITCKNRSEYIKKTLLKNIRDNVDYPKIEFVLLDYNSEDDLHEWVFGNLKKYIDDGVLKYYQTKIPEFFKTCNAKNNSHYVSTGDIVCNLDADNFTKKDFAFYINSVLNRDPDVIGSVKGYYNFPWAKESGGRIFLLKENFSRLGGYDESFDDNYGFDDDDLFHRAVRLGLKNVSIPFYFLKYIKHNNWMRVENLKEKKFDICINKERMESNTARGVIVNKNMSILPDLIRLQE